MQPWRLDAQSEALASLLASGRLRAQDFASATRKIGERRDALEQELAQASGFSATASLLSSQDASGAVMEMDRERFRALFSELVANAVVQQGGGMDIGWRIP